MRLTTEQHDTLAAAIGRREWVKTRSDLERATLVLDNLEKVGSDAKEYVTPLQLSMLVVLLPLDTRDIRDFAERACDLAADAKAELETARLETVNADLLAVARKCEAMLTRQKWLPEGTDPEPVLLREARAAIAKAQS